MGIIIDIIIHHNCIPVVSADNVDYRYSTSEAVIDENEPRMRLLGKCMKKRVIVRKLTGFSYSRKLLHRKWTY